jgi:toxin ParE1/3/4
LIYKVVFSPGAETDLDELEQYLGSRFSEERAQRYVRRIVSYCVSLTTAPYRGSPRNDIRKGLRTVGFERRVTIAFEIFENRIVISGISYAGRRLQEL